MTLARAALIAALPGGILVLAVIGAVALAHRLHRCRPERAMAKRNADGLMGWECRDCLRWRVSAAEVKKERTA